MFKTFNLQWLRNTFFVEKYVLIKITEWNELHLFPENVMCHLTLEKQLPSRQGLEYLLCHVVV